MSSHIDSSKFYSKSLTLPLSILKMISYGSTASEVAKNMGLSRAHVSYYTKRLKRFGYINEVTRDAILVLELTQSGKNFVDQYENQEQQHLPVCRAENIRFKAEVLQMPRVPTDWQKIQMRNWVQYNSTVDTVRVHLNMGDKPMIELIPSPVEGIDPFDLLALLVYDCMNAMHTLEDRLGMKLGRPKLYTRGEWLVYDPVARGFCKSNGQVTYDGIGKVNASKPRCIGEIEYFDPRALVDYLQMPNRVYLIERSIETILEMVERICTIMTDSGYKVKADQTVS